MINRVLIRIKVIQILYSYLLTEKRFMIESQPSNPTKEKRFAYSLYLDLLTLMVRIAESVKPKGKEKPLSDSRFILNVKSDETISALLSKYRQNGFPFYNCIATLAEVIRSSDIYANYIKNSEKGEPDDKFWEDVFRNFIMNFPILLDEIKKRENYTLNGEERTKEMMALTFTNFLVSRDNINDALATLEFSMQKARELYMRLLLLPVELTWLREQQIEENKHKFLPTEEDKNPNLRFVNNRLVKALAENPELEEYSKKKSISWNMEDRRFMDRLLKEIMDSDIYKKYMDEKDPDFETDCRLWVNLLKDVIFVSEEFMESLENKSVFWNDDLDVIGTFILKTIKKYEENQDNPILPMYKDEEDSEFGKELLKDVIKNKELYRAYVDQFINPKQWEAERIAFMDVIITMTALAEIINFPKIPLVVSYNEYVEIAKNYSTSKSGSFVNGILRSIAGKLKEEGKILK